MKERRSDLVVTSFVVDRTQVERLSVVAARERRSRSFLVRMALDRALTRFERSNPRRLA